MFDLPLQASTTALVAFSPTARGFLAGRVQSAEDLEEGDLRRSMPRFQGDNLQHNLALYQRFSQLAEMSSCTPAQLSLAWLLTRAPGYSFFAGLFYSLLAPAKILVPDGPFAWADFLSPHRFMLQAVWDETPRCAALSR